MGCSCGETLGPKLDDLNQLLRRFLIQQTAPSELYETTVGLSAVSIASASGTAVLSLGPPPIGKCWYVEISNKHSSSGNAVLAILVGPKDTTEATFRRDFSPASVDDVASQAPAIYVGPSDFLIASWTGATSGATLTVSYQIRVHRIGTAAPLTAVAG